jgi:hypothetical protein
MAIDEYAAGWLAGTEGLSPTTTSRLTQPVLFYHYFYLFSHHI